MALPTAANLAIDAATLKNALQVLTANQPVFQLHWSGKAEATPFDDAEPSKLTLVTAANRRLVTFFGLELNTLLGLLSLTEDELTADGRSYYRGRCHLTLQRNGESFEVIAAQ